MATHRIESTTRVTRTVHIVEIHDGDTAVEIRRELAAVPATAKLVDIMRASAYSRIECVLTFEAIAEDKGEPG